MTMSVCVGRLPEGGAPHAPAARAAGKLGRDQHAVSSPPGIPGAELGGGPSEDAFGGRREQFLPAAVDQPEDLVAVNAKMATSISHDVRSSAVPRARQACAGHGPRIIPIHIARALRCAHGRGWKKSPRARPEDCHGLERATTRRRPRGNPPAADDEQRKSLHLAVIPHQRMHRQMTAGRPDKEPDTVALVWVAGAGKAYA